jgi:hypothetical protein
MHIIKKLTVQELYEKHHQALLFPKQIEDRPHAIAQLFVDMSRPIYGVLVPKPVGKRAENKRHLAVEKVNREWNELYRLFGKWHDFSPIAYDGYRDLMKKWIAGGKTS